MSNNFLTTGPPDPLEAFSLSTSGARANSVRSHNLKLLARTALFAPQPMSRADLAAHTGLNRSTVTRLADQLINLGILRETSTRITSAGRPATPLVAARHTHVGVGAELGHGSIDACIMDLNGDILAEQHRELNPAKTNAQNSLLILAQMLTDLVTQARRNHLHISGISCGFPGLISSQRGYLYVIPHTGWHDVDLRTTLQNHLQVDIPVSFYNSTTLGAIAEGIAQKQAGEKDCNFIYVSGTTGIGSAQLQGGTAISGLHGWAGELGHVAVSDEKVPCSCGANACLYAFLGKEPLLQAAGIPGAAPWGELYAALARKERKATAALQQAGHYLGRALSSYINLVDADTVILGGNLGRLFEYYSATLREELSARVLFSPWQEVKIYPGIVTEKAGLIGAAWTSLLVMLDEPESWKPPHPQALNYRPVDETPQIFMD